MRIVWRPEVMGMAGLENDLNLDLIWSRNLKGFQVIYQVSDSSLLIFYLFLYFGSGSFSFFIIVT